MKFIKADKKKWIVNLILLLSIAIVIQPILAIGKSNITTSGVLAHDEVWSGKVHITGDVVIPERITLVIQPGTIITFTSNSSDNDVEMPVLEKLGVNKCSLIVKGDLRIKGEKNNKVVMGELVYDVNRQTTISWGGIIFEGSNRSSIIKYSEIRYADVALVFSGSSTPMILDSTIADNDVGIMTFDASSPRIDGNEIRDNTFRGISCYDSSFPMISHNTIKGSDAGIGGEDSSFPIIKYNRFSDNKVGILIQDHSNPGRAGNVFSNNAKDIEIGTK